MDFIQNIYFSFESLGYLKLLLFQIRFQSGVAYKSDAYKKACNIVFSLLKMKKSLCRISLFLCLPGNPLGWYCQKSVAKSGFLLFEGLSMEGGSNLQHTILVGKVIKWFKAPHFRMERFPFTHSNPTICCLGLWDVTSLWGSLWSLGQSSKKVQWLISS